MKPHTKAMAYALDAAADAAGLERALVRAVAWIESRGNPRVVSRAGAMGVLQLMPRTAHGLGVLSDAQLALVLEAFKTGGPAAVRELSDLPTFNPVINAKAGARFLAAMLRQSGGRIDEALARYNWGPGNVNRREGSWPQSVSDRYVQPVLRRLEQERALDADEVTQPDAAPAPADVAKGPRTAEPPFAVAPPVSCSPPVCPSCGRPWPERDGEA